MKFPAKNVVLIMVCLMGMLLNYSAFNRQDNFPDLVEQTTGADTMSSSPASDSDLHEEDQLPGKAEIPSVFASKCRFVSAPFASLLPLTAFAVWEPPKIC